MSEEVAQAAADLATVQQLRHEIATASNVIEGLKRALLGVRTECDYWRGQAQDTLTELHEVEAARNATEAELSEQLRIADAEIAAYAERADAAQRAEADAAALYKEFHAALTTIGSRLYTQGTGANWQMDLLSYVRDERTRLERQHGNAV